MPSQSDLEFWSENRLVNKISRAKAALSLCLAVVGACAVGVSSARAQTAAGEITGLVKDQAGAAVTGATITVTETRTNLQRVVVSTRDGVYTVASLVPGEYRLDIELAGFKSVRRERIRLATGQKARSDVNLAVGSVQEQVTVVGDAPMVRAETASLGTVVENEQVVRLPLNGRVFIMLASIVPGVALPPGAAIKSLSFRDLPMPSTFDTVANIIAETCDIDRDTITPDSHAINDLGIDSLDFLDIAFAIDKAFGIKLPLEQSTQEVNDGKATTEQYFVLKNLCARIDDLVAAKGK